MELHEAAERAFTYTERLGLDTYDPFDIKATPLAVWTYQTANPLRKFVRNVVYGSELLFPIATRKAFGIRKKPSAGGVARWAQAQLAWYRFSNDGAYLERARELLKWLETHPGHAKVGRGWGVPFVWQTYFGTVPADTAVAHTTQSCGHAFLDFYDATKEGWAHQMAEQGAEFLTKGLNQTVRASGAVALSYTPIDTSQVINTNAEVAGFLHRCGREEDQALVKQMREFVVECQGPDGSWPYSAPDSVKGSNPIDNYHTGMTLLGLKDFVTDEPCRRAIENGLAFHLSRHFENDGCPRMRPSSTYPIDSYSAGESLLVLNHFASEEWISDDLREKSRAMRDKLVQYVLTNFALPDGSFIYRRYRHRAMRIDSLRWAQALLCHALAETLIATS